jgi:hypothetical protein
MLDGPGTTMASLPNALPRRLWLRRAGFVAGLLLLGAALLMAWRQRDEVGEAFAAVGDLPPVTLLVYTVVLLGTVAVNVGLSGVTFSALVSRYGRVGFLEMQALIAASALLNYVPMRAGLIGRVAYHRAYNDIPVAASAKVIVQAVGLSVAGALYLGLAIVVAYRWPAVLMIASLLPLAVLTVLAWLAPARRALAIAGVARYAELLVLAVRYWVAFALLGLTLETPAALAFAAVSAMATMIPFLSNGLGAREWAIGWMAQVLTPFQLGLGITADLLNRAAELVGIVPLGLIALGWLARRRRTVRTIPAPNHES